MNTLAKNDSITSSENRLTGSLKQEVSSVSTSVSNINLSINGFAFQTMHAIIA